MARTVNAATRSRSPKYATLSQLMERTSRRVGECIEWTGALTSTGYGHVRLGTRATVRDWKAHRLAWLAGSGQWEIPSGQFVCHHCDNRKCVRFEHLFLGAAADNTHDMMRKGRMSKPPLHRGDSHPARTCPERMARGDANGARLHPERIRRGELHPRAKLTAGNVLHMRALCAGRRPPSFRSIARDFGLSPQAVRAAVGRRTWRHLIWPVI